MKELLDVINTTIVDHQTFRPPPLIHSNTAPTILQTKDPRISLSDFELQYKIGEGGGGMVWACIMKISGKTMAIKIIDKTSINNKKSIDMLVSERTIMSSLNSKFITKLHYAFQGETQIYLVMEFVKGGDLLSLMRQFQRCRMTEDESRFYICELVMAIEHIHSKGISFRDMKPENVLVTLDGHLKVTDFGLASTHCKNDGHLRNNTLCGTPEYMAPEMIKETGHATGVDVWALGCMMYEFLHGVPPYRGGLQQLFEGVLSKKPVFNIPLSDNTKSLITSMLCKDPLKRIGFTKTSNIKQHPFFSDVNWDDVVNQTIIPPMLPRKSGNKIKQGSANLMGIIRQKFLPFTHKSIKSAIAECKELSDNEKSVIVINTDMGETSQVKSVIESARNEARTVIESAKNEARIMIESARNETKTMIESARNETRTMIESARNDVSSISNYENIIMTPSHTDT